MQGAAADSDICGLASSQPSFVKFLAWAPVFEAPVFERHLQGQLGGMIPRVVYQVRAGGGVRGEVCHNVPAKQLERE